MAVAGFRVFRGEVPKLPAYELPPGQAQFANNVDLQHGELRGLRGNAPFTQTTLTSALKSVYTDDGINFFAWPYEVYAVKSMVVGDVYSRLYYTAMQADGPIIKVARTRRSFAGVAGQQVAGTALVGGNFQPPENDNIAPFGNSLGPDSWVLGVPAPAVQGIGPNDQLVATLIDKQTWPGVPKLQLRATFFVEDQDGRIVYSKDITNTEAGQFAGVTYPQVFYTVSMLNADRGNKIQDYLWDLHRELGPRPYKYYWFFPPDIGAAALSRTVDITNTNPLPITITYGGTTVPDPNPNGNLSGDSSGS